MKLDSLVARLHLNSLFSFRTILIISDYSNQSLYKGWHDLSRSCIKTIKDNLKRLLIILKIFPNVDKVRGVLKCLLSRRWLDLWSWASQFWVGEVKLDLSWKISNRKEAYLSEEYRMILLGNFNIFQIKRNKPQREIHSEWVRFQRNDVIFLTFSTGNNAKY